MTKNIDEMTKEELIQALIEKSDELYRQLILAEKMYGHGSELANMKRSRWFAIDNFCTSLNIDVDSVPQEELL